ncbi:sensor domain-containing protein [Halorarum halobium]|uniref:sensor domain-containing protein n=1 Tax=Halorarum halobium TaxID=3075121 RepID=UPI0028A903AA|nr:sensor domain-containing protein [Halobaculum sp. XH14]
MSRTQRASVGGRLRSFFAVPFRPQTYLNLLYLSLALPLGFLYFTFVSIGVSLGAALLFVVVGAPLLAVVLAASLGLAGLERWLTTALLGVELEAPTRIEDGSFPEQLVSLATDRGTWTALIYLPTKLLFGLASFTVVMSTLTTGVSLLFVPLYYDQPGVYVGLVAERPVELHPALYFGWNRLLVGFDAVVTVGSWQVTTLAEALFVAGLGVSLCLVGLHVLNALARLSGWYARLMLGDTFDVVGAARRSFVG